MLKVEHDTAVLVSLIFSLPDPHFISSLLLLMLLPSPLLSLLPWLSAVVSCADVANNVAVAMVIH